MERVFLCVVAPTLRNTIQINIPAHIISERVEDYPLVLGLWMMSGYKECFYTLCPIIVYIESVFIMVFIFSSLCNILANNCWFSGSPVF